MMAPDRKYPPGSTTIFAIFAGALAWLIVGGIAFVSCQKPAPAPSPGSSPAARSEAAATSSAIASASVASSSSIRVVFYPPEDDQGDELGGDQGQHGGIVPPGSPARAVGPYKRSGRVEVVIDQVVQASATSAATSSAIASASAPVVVPVENPGDNHGRLGITAATVPGILLVDLQLLQLDVSPATRWLVDAPMAAGLDVVGNLEAVGVGVSLGGKTYATAGAWTRWNLSTQGLYLGVGLRF